MKTLEFSCQLLKLSILTWLSWLHIVHSLSVVTLSDDENNEVESDDINLRNLLIYPGTKWCGAGNISSSYDDLGEAIETDKCCREHDHCPDVIEAGQSKHNLTNNTPFTRLSCDCDQTFYDCLKKNNDPKSEKLGTIYFDILPRQCYKEEYPVIGCKRQNKKYKRECEEYLLDETKPKKYQWFDLPVYRCN